MPSITLTVDATQASRIQDALSAAGYAPTPAGLKQLLMTYIQGLVENYEKRRAQQALASPPTVTIS